MDFNDPWRDVMGFAAAMSEPPSEIRVGAALLLTAHERTSRSKACEKTCSFVFDQHLMN